MTDDHSERLHKAAVDYRRAVKRAEQIIEGPRHVLRDAIREAYANGKRKSEILRDTDHVWSRTWVDKAVGDMERRADQ